jgi:hypothetical protein
MTPGSSRTSAPTDPSLAHRSAWLAALLLYGFAAAGDFAYHLVEDLRTGNEAIEASEVAVAFSAALFWPADLVAMSLLAAR